MRGNPHAAFDEAGAGNAAWSRWCDTRRRMSEPIGNTNFDLNRRASPRPYQAKQACRAETDAQTLEEVCLCSRAVGHRRLAIVPRPGTWGSKVGTNGGDGRTTEPRIRISRRGGGNARCSGSRPPAPRRNSSRAMLPSTTPSTSNAISRQPQRTARSAPRRWTRGGPQSQRPDNS